MLHDPLVAQELAKLMLLPYDVDVQKSQTLGEG